MGVKPVRRVGRQPRRIRHRTWTRRATARPQLRPPYYGAAAGGDAAGAPRTAGTRLRHRHRRMLGRDTRRPRRSPRRTIGTAARAARSRPVTTVPVRRAAADAAPCRRKAATGDRGAASDHVAASDHDAASGRAAGRTSALRAADATAVGWATTFRPKSRWWRSSCPCWPYRPATRCAVLGRCSAEATRTRIGGAAVVPRPDGGDDGGRGVTAAGGAAPRGSGGRDGTVADGEGSAAAVAVRTAPASPGRCRPATHSTRCLCGWRPAGLRPRSIPFLSLYSLLTNENKSSIKIIHNIIYQFSIYIVGFNAPQ